MKKRRKAPIYSLNRALFALASQEGNEVAAELKKKKINKMNKKQKNKKKKKKTIRTKESQRNKVVEGEPCVEV